MREATPATEDLLCLTEERVGPGAHLIALFGEMDRSNEQQVRVAVERALQREAKHLIVDLGRLSFMDSSGVRILLLAHRALMQQHGTLALVAPSGVVLRILNVMHLANSVPVYASVSQALAELLPDTCPRRPPTWHPTEPQPGQSWAKLR